MTIEKTPNISGQNIEDASPPLTPDLSGIQPVKDRVSPLAWYDHAIATINHRYSRLLSAEVENPDALTRPNWLGQLAHAFVEIEYFQRSNELPPQSEAIDPASWLQDKFKVITEYLRIHSPEEVRQFAAILGSLRHFKYGVGTSIKSSSSIFSYDATELVLDGTINAKTIAAWFDVIGGLASMNPALMQTIFSSGGDLSPLVGSNRLKMKDVLLPVGSEKPHPFTHLREAEIWMRENIADGALDDLMADLEKKERGKHNTALTPSNNTINNLREFSLGVAKDLAELEGFEEVVQSANSLAVYLEDLGLSGNEVTEINRPNPPQNIFVQVATALTEYLQNQTDFDISAERTVAKKLVATLRRNRIALTRRDLLTFFVGFRKSDAAKPDLLPKSSKSYIGQALEGIGRQVDPKKADEIKLTVSDRIIPELILQTRMAELHTFTWQARDYEALGLDPKTWIKHQNIITNNDKSIPGPSRFPAKGILIDYFGQFQPPHVGHTEFIRELSALSKLELIRSGLLEPWEYSSGTLVGVSVNKGNPAKMANQWPYPFRRDMLIDSLREHTNVFAWPEAEKQGTTLEKLIHHLHNLTVRGRRPTRQVIARGTDKLHKDLKQYVKDKDGMYSGPLNTLNHIFAVQADELSDVQTLINNLYELFRNFPDRVMVILGSHPEVHSSYFNKELGNIDDATLSTLVHPSIIGKLREMQNA